MFKAIKDNKIIAFNETSDFPCMKIGSDIDEIVEDTEHQMSDYVMVENEFVLDTDAEAIEKQKEQRIAELEESLKSTDWYAIRFADTGEEIPTDIKKARQEARDEISRLRGGD